MFDLEQFIAGCRDAVTRDSSHKAVREVVARAVSDPAAVVQALGEPRFAGVDVLYRGDDMTIFNVVWAPLMTILPHDHRTWAVIGVMAGAKTMSIGAGSAASPVKAGSRQPAPARCRPAMSSRWAATSSTR